MKIYTTATVVCVSAGLAFAGTGLEITSNTIDGGAGTSSGGTLELSGTIGQPDATVSVGGALADEGGFWRRLPNDSCTDPLVIGSGATPYTTISATTDGPVEAECQFDGQTYQDVYFAYFAECDGLLTVSTCEELGGFADYDTDIAVYQGCDTDPCTFDLLGCNDDDPVNPCGGNPFFHSTVIVPVLAGNCYKIRVGGYLDGDFGTGELFVACNEINCDPTSGDVTGDDCVTFADILEILGAWGTTGDPGIPGDANCDGMVTFADILVVLGDWGNGAGCP